MQQDDLHKNLQPVLEFPLTSKTALNLIRTLATNYSHKVRIGQHTRERMQQRGVTVRDIFNVLQSPRTIMIEEPAPQAMGGNYTCTLKGVSAGESITIALLLKSVDLDPSAKTITVYFN